MSKYQLLGEAIAEISCRPWQSLGTVGWLQLAATTQIAASHLAVSRERVELAQQDKVPHTLTPGQWLT